MPSEKSPSITVLVPSIGRLEYLSETRRSLENQTRSDFRVLILDNASLADAQAFFASWAKADPRVTVARVDERVPMFANFNRGMRATTTPFVTFFHDDDVYLPRYLEVLVGALESHPGAAFSGSNFDFIDANGVVIDERRWIARTELWSGPRYINELVGRSRNTVPMPGLVFRRDAFGPDGFDERLPIYFGDFVLLMRAAELRGMVACAEPVVRIRKHADQASQMCLSKSIAIRTEVLTRYLDELTVEGRIEPRLLRSLRRRVSVTRRAALVWGWLSAEEASERAACLKALGDRAPDQVARLALDWVDRHGLRPERMGSRLISVVRTIAHSVGI